MSKIEELTKHLILEIEAEGREIKTQERHLSHVDIWIYKGKLSIGNGAWKIECGEVAV